MQEEANWYWEQKNKQQVIIVTTRTIVHPCLYVVAVKDVQVITRSVCSRNQSKKSLQRHTISLTDYNHDYILEEIERRDKFKYKINIRDDGD